MSHPALPESLEWKERHDIIMIMKNISITKNIDYSILFSRGLTDFLKFIAALLIALGHYSSVVNEQTSNLVYKILPLFSGYVGVAIFFFFSGYGLMMSEKRNHLPLKSFLVKRILKVYFPVVIVSFLWQIVLWPDGRGLDYVPHALYTIFFGGLRWYTLVC